MYELLISLQYIGIAIFVVEIIFALCQKNSRLQIILLMLFMACLINLTGYLFEMQSTTMQTSIMAVKFIYLGKPYIPFLLLLFAAECCKVKLPRIMNISLAVFHMLISMLVISCQHQSFYYSSINYTEEGLFPHLVLGHGVVYVINTVLIFIYFIVIMTMSIRRRMIVSSEIEKKQLSFLIMGAITAMIGFGLFLSGLTNGYDTTALSYLIGTVFLSILLFKYKLFDVVSVAKESVLDQFGNGIVVIDNYNTILYKNKRVGEIIEGDVEIDRLEELAIRKGRLHKDDRVYDIWKRDIDNNGSKYGSIYTIADITDDYNYANRLEIDVEKKTENIRVLQHDITLGLANIIESRDNNTGGHVKRTSDVIKIFVEELRRCDHKLDLSDSFLQNVINAAPMHDLGKIAVPDEILNKPGKYTDNEYAQMKTHAAKGATLIEQMLSGIEDRDFYKIAMNIAHYHHEKWDGTGYPNHLNGERIPVEARIMALADVFDALVSKRCYKDKMSYDKAFSIIEESLGTHFDKELGEHFMDCRAELERYYDEC